MNIFEKVLWFLLVVGCTLSGILNLFIAVAKGDWSNVGIAFMNFGMAYALWTLL